MEDKPLNAMKYDSDKTPVQLLPVIPLMRVAAVFGFGARKYAENSWRAPDRKPVPLMRTYGSVLRHLFLWAGGQDIDPGSGLPHLAHACTQLMILMEHQEMGEAADDRVYQEYMLDGLDTLPEWDK